MNGGGAERQLAYLSGELARVGWEVHVALLSGGSNMDRLEATGAVIHKLAVLHNYDPSILWQLIRIIREVRPDLIQVWLTQMEILGGIAAEILRVPWVFSERCSTLAYPPKLKNWLRVFIASRASAIVSNSKGGDQNWQTRPDTGVPRWVIRNALPLDEIETAQPATWEEIGLESEQQVVLYVGRFHPHKNLSTLLLALCEVVSRPGIVAVLCGDGPLQEFIKRRLNEYLIAGRVLLPGYVSAVWNWMKRADVFVSVSLLEGHPNAVLEAMACGCPLVVSDILSHREFLDEQSALLVNPRAPATITRAIRSVLSDPEAAKRRVLNARAQAAQWSIPAIARQYERVYEQVLDRNKPLRLK